MKSRVTMGRTVLSITVVFYLVMAVALVAVGSVMPRDGGNAALIAAFVVIMLTLVATPFFKPLCLNLTDSELLIRFLIHSIRIPLSEIEAVEDREKYKDYINVRTFGSGGVWGFLGKFHNNGVGHYTSYAADLGNSFYVRLRSGKVYLISCDEKSELMKLLQRRLLAL